MKIKPYQTNIDFADSEYRFFHMSSNQTLTIFLSSWQERQIKIDFFNAIRFSFSLGDVISNLFEVSDSVFLYDAIDQYYVTRPSEQPFKHFQIIDIFDFPFIEIVAERAEILLSD